MSNKVFTVAKVLGIGLTIIGSLFGAFGEVGDMKDAMSKLKTEKGDMDESEEEKQ